MLTPKDDLRHPLPDHPLARESLYWNLLLPDEGLAVLAYLWVTPSSAGRFVIACGPQLEPIAFEVCDGSRLEGTDLDRCEVEGLELRQPEPLATAQLSYEAERLGLEYRFAATHEAFDYARNPDGCLPAMAENRFEQAGLVEGTLRLDGREISFSTTAERDHSWGRRDWSAMHHYKWISAQAGPDLALNAMITLWRGETRVNGFIWRDGRLGAVVDARAAVEYDSTLHQRTIDLELRDELGRRMVAKGERFAGVQIPMSGVSIVESACRFSIDDAPGVGIVEILWPEGYREHFREAAA